MARRLDALISAAHSEARVTEAALLRDSEAGPLLLAEAAFRCAALAQSGRCRAARSICEVVPHIERYVAQEAIDVDGQASFSRRNMDTAVLADLASVEQSRMPDTH